MTSGKNIFGAFTVAVALFFFWTAVVGSWQKVSALKDARDARNQLLQQRTAILDKIAKEYRTYTANVSGDARTRFSAVVPVKKDTAELVSAVQAMTSDAGLQLNELKTTDATKSGGGDQFRTISLNLDLSGSYPALRTFLGDLEQYVRILNVNTIEVNADTKAAGRLRFTIRADAYFLK
jgi:Tfp pilus assembly protein PilO